MLLVRSLDFNNKGYFVVVDLIGCIYTVNRNLNDKNIIVSLSVWRHGRSIFLRPVLLNLLLFIALTEL